MTAFDFFFLFKIVRFPFFNRITRSYEEYNAYNTFTYKFCIAFVYFVYVAVFCEERFKSILTLRNIRPESINVGVHPSLSLSSFLFSLSPYIVQSYTLWPLKIERLVTTIIRAFPIERKNGEISFSRIILTANDTTWHDGFNNNIDHYHDISTSNYTVDIVLETTSQSSNCRITMELSISGFVER